MVPLTVSAMVAFTAGVPFGVRTHTLAIVMASPRGNRANTNDFATESFKLQLQQLIQTPRPVQ